MQQTNLCSSISSGDEGYNALDIGMGMGAAYFLGLISIWCFKGFLNCLDRKRRTGGAYGYQEQVDTGNLEMDAISSESAMGNMGVAGASGGRNDALKNVGNQEFL